MWFVCSCGSVHVDVCVCVLRVQHACPCEEDIGVGTIRYDSWPTLVVWLRLIVGGEILKCVFAYGWVCCVCVVCALRDSKRLCVCRQNASHEASGKDTGEWRRQAGESEGFWGLRPGPSSPRELAPESLDDEVNMEMEVEGSVKAEQAAEASRRRQREQLEAAPGDPLSQMRVMKEEVIRREKAETWERAALTEKKVDNHEVKVQEHDKKLLDLENAVAELNNRPSMSRSQPREGNLGYLDESQRLDGLGGTTRGVPGL